MVAANMPAAITPTTTISDLDGRSPLAVSLAAGDGIGF